MSDLLCREITRRLPEYHAGLLGSAQRERVAAHLETCATCRAELGALEQTASLLEGTGLRKPARDLWPGVEAQLSPREGRRAGRAPAWMSWRRWAVPALAVVAIVAIAVALLPQGAPPEAPLVVVVDREAPTYARWHAEASMGSVVADRSALALVVLAGDTGAEASEDH